MNTYAQPMPEGQPMYAAQPIQQPGYGQPVQIVQAQPQPQPVIIVQQPQPQQNNPADQFAYGVDKFDAEAEQKRRKKWYQKEECMCFGGGCECVIQ